MSSIWFSSFKDIEWSKAMGAAKSMVEKGRSLWTRAAERTSAGSGAPERLKPPPAAGAEALAALEIRLHDLEGKVARVDEEIVSSFDVVRALTEQHSQLAQAVDVLIARTRVLLRACVLLGIAVVCLLALLLIH